MGALVQRGVFRRPPELVADAGHQRSVTLGFGPIPRPALVRMERAPRLLAMRQAVIPQDVVQFVGGPDTGLPEADHADAVLLKVTERDRLDAAIQCRQLAGHGFIAAGLTHARSRSGPA